MKFNRKSMIIGNIAAYSVQIPYAEFTMLKVFEEK
jgi:hypothetical protein